MFQFYARHFDTVEINNSFYRLPTAKTFDAWRESSPRKFCFAVKASRFITHMKKLKEPESSAEGLLTFVFTGRRVRSILDGTRRASCGRGRSGSRAGAGGYRRFTFTLITIRRARRSR